MLGLAPIACAKKVTASGSQSCANKTNTAAGIWMDAECKKAWQMFDEDSLHARGRKGWATPQVCGEACDNARLPDLRTPVPHPNFTGRQKTLVCCASRLSVLSQTSHKSCMTPCLALLPTAVAGCLRVPPPLVHVEPRIAGQCAECGGCWSSPCHLSNQGCNGRVVRQYGAAPWEWQRRFASAQEAPPTRTHSICRDCSPTGVVVF